MTESLTIMQEIMRSRATHNLHYGVRPRHEYFVNVQQGKNAYYGSKRTSGKNVPECKTHWKKSSVTYGKYRENSVAFSFFTSELVVVENNSMSGLVPPRVQQDASLAFDPSQQGKSAEEIGDAIDASHLGPSWGTTYKVHPVVQAGGDVSIGTYGRTYAISADDNHVSINGGDAYGIGAHAGATIGLSFGPYFPGIIGTPEHDFSINAGAGVTSWGLSGSKDGIGFSFGVGPSWGVSATKFGDVDVNGNNTEDLYHHDFK